MSLALVLRNKGLGDPLGFTVKAEKLEDGQNHTKVTLTPAGLH